MMGSLRLTKPYITQHCFYSVQSEKSLVTFTSPLRNNDHLPTIFFRYLRLWITHKLFQFSITPFAGIGRTRYHRKFKGVVIDDIPARIGKFHTEGKSP